MLGLSKLEAWIIIAGILSLAIFAGGAYEHHVGYVAGQKDKQVELDAFKNDVAAKGLKAEQDKVAKEKADNEKITAAVADRDVALSRLRAEQARPRGGFVPSAAANTADGRKICYDRATLDAALRKLDTGVSSLAAEGDGQVINALTLLKAWPK